MSDSVRPHRRQPNRLHRPWDSPGKHTGVGCHFLLQCMKVKSLSRVRLLATPWTAAYQAPPSMGFSRQEYWSGCHRLLRLSPLHTPYLLRVLSAQQQQQRNCPSTAADLSQPEPLFPPPLSAWLPDWVVSICPRSDWLFSFCWKPWVLDPFTANQRLQLSKPQPQHSALAVNTPVECSRTTPCSESMYLGRRGKERIKDFKTPVKTCR